MAFTNLYCRSGGNNLNAGTLDGSTTEPGTSPLVTFVGGDYNASSNTYTAPVGSSMAEVQVGRWAAVYNDGDTVPTLNQWSFGRISAVNSGARTFTLAFTINFGGGTEVSTGTGNRSARISGAWAGFGGTSSFPFGTVQATAVNAAGNPTRVLLKNDQTYSMTAAIPSNNLTNVSWWGYSSTTEDDGIAEINGSGLGSGTVLLTLGNGSGRWRNFKFNGNGSAGTATGVVISGADWTMERCIFQGMRGYGAAVSQQSQLVECEFADNDKSATGLAGAQISVSTARLIRCAFHHNDDSATTDGCHTSTAVTPYFEGCIFAHNGRDGLRGSAANVGWYLRECDFFANVGSGIFHDLSTGNRIDTYENCNFVDNGAFGVDPDNAQQVMVLLINCGFGRGTRANNSGDFDSAAQVNEISSVVYANDVTPWVDPDNGDFRVSLATAKGTGRGKYLLTHTYSAGGSTIGYPDVGSAQHLESGNVIIFKQGVI